MTINPVHSRNRILAALSEQEWTRLTPHLESVSLARGTPLSEADEPIRHTPTFRNAALPRSCARSDGARVDTTIVGRDGMVGLPVFLGTSRVTTSAMVQIDMGAQRISAEDLRAELDRGGTLVSLLQRYTQMVIVETAFHERDAKGRQSARVSA